METTEKQAAAASAAANGDEAAVPVAASDSECQKLAEADKAEADKGKRMVRVSQKYIDIVLREKSTGTGMYRKNRAMEIVENYKGPLDLRSLVAISNGIREKIHADDAAILEQYHRLGYAYAEVEEEEEEEPSIDNEKVCTPLARSRPQVPPA